MLKTFEDFIRQRWLWITPLSEKWLIAVMGLAGETGEVIEPCKKHFRDGKHPGDSLKLELGDVLHYLTVIARSYGWTLEDLMAANIAKLEERDAAKRVADVDVYDGFVQPPGYTSDV